MADKIIVEFSRKELEKECENCAYDKETKKLKSKEPALSICSRTDNDIVLCNLRHILDFKIKEKNNENKGTEDNR